MTPLWTSTEAAAATGGRATRDFAVTGISIDTRTLLPGDLFVALSAVRDGHEFVAQALAKGAGAALVSHWPEGVAADAPMLVVPDVQTALEALGRAARARTQARVIGVTGSVGKTSTKEMLRAVLSGQGRTHAAQASYNNHWGVPLTLARMPADTEFAVIEIGMNHPGEIAPLSRMARPHVAMITTVAPAHLEAFESIEGIAHEKAAILDGLEPGGVAILNADIATAPILRAKAESLGAEQVWFGEAASADWRLSHAQLAQDMTVASAATPMGEMLFKVGSTGRHFAINALAVLAAAAALGADPAISCADLGRWAPPAGRGMRERIGLDPIDPETSFDLIDDAFNANPASMAAALAVLAATVPRHGIGRIEKGRRIAILGDMLELGQDELTMHLAIAVDPALQRVDLVHCVGPRMKALYGALPVGKRGEYSADAASLAPRMPHLVDAGDVVLVKGSKGIKVSSLVDVLRKLGHGRTPTAVGET
jgi:UDP-N-acetylmuramoyl-tripeptide--D-alanyl-D-alanine ligase